MNRKSTPPTSLRPIASSTSAGPAGPVPNRSGSRAGGSAASSRGGRAWTVALCLALIGWTPAFADDAASADGVGADGAAVAPVVARPLAVPGISARAQAKLDPRLLYALVQPRENDEALRIAGQSLRIYGRSPQELVFPVFIDSELSDAELADLGAQRNSRAGDLVTAWVEETDLDRIASHPGVRSIEASYPMHTFLDQSLVETGARLINQPPSGFTGDGVLYGLLDDGIDLTHDDFKDAGGGSRVLFVWDHAREGGTPPQGFSYGHEYTKAQIDAGQASQFVNEGGHGSHVAGISVGDGSAGSSGGIYQGIAWEADIIAVRNGGCDLFCYGEGAPWGREVWGSSGTVESVDALTYFARKADQLGRPLVINQSQGVTMGPHDGTTKLEQFYDQVIAQNDLIVVVAAGNDQEADWHAVVNVGANQTQNIVTQHHGAGGNALQPYITFELWWDQGDAFELTLTGPGGGSLTIPTNSNNDVLQGTLGNDTVFAYTTPSYPTNGQGNAWFLLLGANNGQQPVTTGTWTVGVRSLNNSSGPVHFYGERNQFGFSVNNPNLDSILGMPGTADEVITVASYNTRFTWPGIDGPSGGNDSNPIGGISSFSSNGPRRGVANGVADKPDLAAPGMFIASAFAAGSSASRNDVINDGEHVVLAGTSMAAPHVAGTIALMLEKNPALTRSQVRQILTDTAEDGGAGWRKTFGHGKLRTKLAVDAVGGGGGGDCANPGDANLNGSVDVLDVVATVNHIIGRQTLSGDGQECADLDGTSGIAVGDLAAIVAEIMSTGAPRPALLAAKAEPVVVGWGEEVVGSSYRLLLEPDALGALTVSFVPPRGYELAGAPQLLGVRGEVSLAWNELPSGLVKLVAYDPLGRGLAGSSDPVTLEIPFSFAWDGGQSLSDFAISGLELADPSGRQLVLAANPNIGGTETVAGVRSFLRAAYPNPADEITRIRYELARSGDVDVEVFDAAGRKIRRLASGYQLGGPHTLNWDGRDDAGQAVAAGVYFVRLGTEDGGDSQKIQIVR